MLGERGQPCVLVVRSNQSVKFLEGWMPVQTDPAAMAAAIPAEDWRTLAAGEGAKGPRLSHWARLPLRWIGEAGFERWLLIRRSRHDPEALAYSFACAPSGTSLAELAGAAGLRWSIEQSFQHTRDDLGLDHCEARSWHGWHRHMSLVMAAAAYLAKLSADRRRHAFGDQILPGDLAGGCRPWGPGAERRRGERGEERAAGRRHRRSSHPECQLLTVMPSASDRR